MSNPEDLSPRNPPRPGNWGLVVLLFALAAVVTAGGIYAVREHRETRQLAAGNQALVATLGTMQTQLQALSEKLNALSVQQPAPSSQKPAALGTAVSESKPRVRTAPRRMTAHRQPPDDPRWKQMQSQLSDQQKELASTRDEVARAREDLQGKLSSTRDELNGSIARTHDEVVTLAKRGERNYFEFQLSRSKQFQRVGPISLSLRKVNFKKKSYDVNLMVDDFQLNKKSVNLYEPVWITLSDRPQPLELVVNRIEKDKIQGYLSEPKYKKSELTASVAPAAPAQPAATPAGDKTTAH